MSYSDHRSRGDYEQRERERERSSRHHNQPPSSSSSSSYHQVIVYDERDKYAGDYVSICLKNLTDTLTDTELSDSIYREFRKFGNFNVKVVYDRNMTHDRRAERIAFINFDTHEQAREAKRIKLNITFHGLPLYIEPVFRNRSSIQQQPPPPPPPPPHYHHHHHRVSTPPLPSSHHHKSTSRRRSSSTSSSRRTKHHHHQEVDDRRRNSDHHQIKSSRRKNKSRSLSPPPPQQQKRLNHHHKSSEHRISRHHEHEQQQQQHQRYVYVSPPSPPPPQHRYQSSNRYQQQQQHHEGTLTDHIYKPELNDKDVTRTLFIGNLDPDVDETELRKLFVRFGYIEDIDIKRIPNKKPYAFIKYINLDMANNAKMEMNDKLVGKYEIKIGFGKVQPTNCLWIGGLSSRSKKTSLEKYFGNYGKIREIDWNPGDQYAYILFDSVSDAEDARNHLNEKPLPNSSSTDDELRIDYADPKRFESVLLNNNNNNNDDDDDSRSPRSLTISNSFQSRSRSVSLSPPPPPPQQPQTTKRINNGNYNSSSGSNDEKGGGIKRQKLNSTLSRKIKTPPPPSLPSIQNEEQSSPSSSSLIKHRHNKRHHHHHNRDHHDDDVELKIDNSSEIEMNLSQKEEEEDEEEATSHNSNLLIKDALILNKESHLNRIVTIDDINTKLKHTWFGAFTLKKIAFPTKFYCLAGNKNLAEELLPPASTTSQSVLRITQRLRLDPSKVEELEKKLYDSNYTNLQTTDSNCQFSVLIALPNELDKQTIISNKNEELSSTTGGGDTDGGDSSTIGATTLQQRSLHNLIIYLNQKTAAGVIPLPDDNERPTAIVHAFPPNCQFSIKLLKQLLPNVKLSDLLLTQQQQTQSNGQINNDYLIVVLLKN